MSEDLSSEGAPRCWAEIRLDRLAQNSREIRNAVGPETRMISVVKADGYGLGAISLARALAGAGIDFFAVANGEEARALRAVIPHHPILLLSATAPEEEESIVRDGFIPTLSTEEELRRFQSIGARMSRQVPVHLKIDTGMGRLGRWHEEAAEFLPQAVASASLRVDGIYTHFACGGEDLEFTNLQRERFLAILARARLPADALIHADNSGGAETFPGSPFNAVRIGLLQLGCPAASGRSRFEVEPVASLHSRVTVLKDLPRGATVSYNRSHLLRRPARTAVVAAGYADGIPRACGNRGKVLIRGKRCPILGHVTMDETIVDVTGAGPVDAGDKVTFFGEQDRNVIPLREFSEWSKSIPWESLCRLSSRVKRVYIE